RDPEFTLDTGGRTGTCDVLTFLPDGKTLLAAGDDRVVHAWPVTAAGLTEPPRVLRWPSWREERGGIKALAQDPATGRIALGGKGPSPAFAAAFDRRPGEVVAAPSSKARPPEQREKLSPISALASRPDGARLAYGTGDGSVWVWDFRGFPVRIGTHG